MAYMEKIPIVWSKPHDSANLFHTETINILLDKFIKKYHKRLKIRNIMVDLEMPKDAAGYSNKTFIVKLHLTLKSGRIIIAESQERNIANAMKNITREIEHQSHLTDRQKHHDSSQKVQ